ncbi:helix-turn-helix transcriptional regulator [Synechocystis salina LEGE 06155]|nr:helix-turn-helix transcriptional regulator [Synechocystis salina LEGE 06155]
MLHKALKLMRVFNQIKQKDLAQYLDISRSHLSEIESGKKRPSVDLLEKYSEVFDVPMSNIIFFSEYIEDGTTIETQKLRTIFASKIVSMMEFVANKIDGDIGDDDEKRAEKINAG